MNSLEAEYSFLAPTWKLPTVATTSMYSPTYGTPYISNAADVGPDWSLWHNSMYNSRYIPSYVPSTTTHRNYPLPRSHQQIVPPIIPHQQQQLQQQQPQQQQQHQQQQNYQSSGERTAQSGPPYYQQQQNNPYGNYTGPDDGLNLTISLHPNNEYDMPTQPHNNIPNYGPTKHPTVNRGLTYSINGQNNPSHPHPHPPPPQPSQKRHVQIIDSNRQTPSIVANGYTSDRNSRNSNFHNNHTPDPNHYQQKYKPPPPPGPSVPNQRREHVEENRHGYTGNNYNIHEYLYGLAAPDPGSYVNAFKHQQRRLQDEKAGRKSVMSEFKTFAQNGGFGPAFGDTDHQKYEEKVDTEKKRKSYSRIVRETNQYKLEEQKRNGAQQKTRPVPVPKYKRFQSEPSSQSAIISPILTTALPTIPRRSNFDCVNFLDQSEVNMNQPRRSSSLSSILIKRRVRFRSRDFIRRRSSTLIDLPSHITGIHIPRRIDSSLPRFTTKKSSSKILDEKDHFQKPSNKKEKKFITSHSMITNNMRLPPTATVVIKPSPAATTSTNNIRKSTLSSIKSSQRPLTARFIPGPIRKTTIISKPHFDLTIRSFHQNTTGTNDKKNSSNQ